jgi:hypothetical protein
MKYENDFFLKVPNDTCQMTHAQRLATMSQDKLSNMCAHWKRFENFECIA